MTQAGYKAALLLPALLGCDIVQGFQDAGNALFPEQSTHLSTPALRLVKGGYRRIALAAGRELSVLARSAEGGTSLVVMRFANPEPCEIPDVARYVASRNPNRAEAGIAYFREDTLQGTLHFADTSCKTFDFEIDDARLPVGETETSIIVWAGGDLLEVDPAAGKRKVLSTAVTNVITRAFSGRVLVRRGDGLEVFGSDWKSQGSFGKNVTSIIKTRQGVLYLDDTGLRRLSSGPGDLTTEDTLIAEGACNLGMRGDWAGFHAPCADARLHVLNEPSGHVYDLDFNADPRYLRPVPAHGSAGEDPTKDPFWFLFLRDVSSSVGTFVVKDPEGSERVIGENATLDYLDLVDSGSESYGYALVNVQDGLGDYVYWNADGAQQTLGRRAYTGANRLLVDWDGTSGSLAVASGNRLAIVAEHVPPDAFEFTDGRGEWTVLFHDWQGESGRLSRLAGTLSALAGTPADAPFSAPELTEVAPSVGRYTTASLGDLLPGAAFLESYDTTAGTGRLSYENAELRFKAIVDHGVSDYLVTSDYLLYAIPEGRDQGIWLATGK